VFIEREVRYLRVSESIPELADVNNRLAMLDPANPVIIP